MDRATSAPQFWSILTELRWGLENMEDPVRSKLDAIFRYHHAVSKRAEAKRTRAADEREAATLRAFAAARNNVIRPAMEEMGEYVKAQGYTYTIDTEADGLGPDRAYNKADIRLTLYVDDGVSVRKTTRGLRCFATSPAAWLSSTHERLLRGGAAMLAWLENSKLPT
jgi:hypothetical protein